MDDKVFLTVDEVVAATGIGRTKVFALMKSGDLKSVKIGRRTLIKPDDLKLFASACASRHAA